jgi:hypothetical protein
MNFVKDIKNIEKIALIIEVSIKKVPVSEEQKAEDIERLRNFLASYWPESAAGMTEEAESLPVDSPQVVFQSLWS